MDDSTVDSELFNILRQIAIVSAALIHNLTNREELLFRREALVQAASALGFVMSEDDQQQLLRRLSTQSEAHGSGRPTRDHNEIRTWAMNHDAIPAEVYQPFFDQQPTALRFLSGEAKLGTPELKPITWEDFFARFDLMGLAVSFDEAEGYEFIADSAPGLAKPPINQR